MLIHYNFCNNFIPYFFFLYKNNIVAARLLAGLWGLLPGYNVLKQSVLVYMICLKTITRYSFLYKNKIYIYIYKHLL